MLGTGKRGLSTYIKELFKNGEQGFFYDPNDLSTMFRDSAGTVPVTGVGQPVGLMLDKSKGVILGSEKNPNPSFSTNLDGWAAGSASSAIVENGEARVVFGGAITASATNWFSLNGAYTVGKVYTVSFDATYVSSGGNLQAGFGYAAGITVLPSQNLGIKQRYTFTAAGNFNAPTALLSFAATSAGSVWKIDNVSVKEVLGNHAYQTTSAARPVLRQNAITGAYYLEFDGSDDFLQTNNIDFTGTDKVSLFAGVRKLSDASRAILVEFGIGVGLANGSFGIEAPRLGTANAYSFVHQGSASSVAVTSGQLYPAPHSAVLVGKGNLSDSLSESIKVNSTITVGPNTTAGANTKYANYPLYIGRRTGTSLPFNGHIYGLIGIGKLVSDNETTIIEKELAKRTGVTLNV